MTYYFAKKLAVPFTEAVEKITAELKKLGFGILTEIDVKATLKKKLDVDFRPYKILGACNPPFAHKALQAEDKIGLMLPCNVIVQELGENEVEVAAIDPVAAMGGIENTSLKDISKEVQKLLEQAINNL